MEARAREELQGKGAWETQLLSPKCLLVLLCLSLLAGLAAISGDSLWIDEGLSAFFAQQPDFGSLIAALRVESSADAQVPFHQAYLWLWEKGFGHGEFTLRLSNLPWLLLGNGALLLAMRRAGVRRNVAIFFVLAAALSPFLGFYLNQVRCYSMQYGCACLILAYLLEISTAPERAFRGVPLLHGVSGVFLLCGTSLVAVAWSGTALLAAAWIVWKSRAAGIRAPRPGPWAVALLGIAAAGLAFLGVYYLGTLLRGARASGGETNWGTILYCGYEMSGLAGLGPARNDLRGAGLGVLRAYGPQLAAGGAVVWGVLIAGGLSYLRRASGSSLARRALAFLLLPLLFTFGMGAAVHFRVLGRHLMGVFPLFLFLTALALAALFETRRKSLPFLLLAVWACSAGLLRFSSVHRRDDYRSAAALARQTLEAGQRVWWVADERTGAYYGLDFAQEQPALRAWMNATREKLAGEPEPDGIFLSKGEIYDHGKAVEDYIASHGYVPGKVLPAFTFFVKRR